MLFVGVIQNTKVLFIIPFTAENACPLTWALLAVIRKSVDGAKGQEGGIWCNRLSEMVLA